MIIYVTHSRNFDYQTELYLPLKNSSLSKKNSFILPHDRSDKPFDSKTVFSEKKCDLVIAEISFPSTSQGIELGWADMKEIPIVCIIKEGTTYSQSIKAVTNHFISYADKEQLMAKLADFLNSYPLA